MIANANTIAAGTATSAPIAQNNSRVDKDAFLELLVAQLQNQDPMNPTSNDDFMGQLAQMEEMENSQNLNKSFEEMNEQLTALLGQNSMLSASNLLGTQVKTTSGGGLTTGIVDKISVVDGEIKLAIDGYKKVIGDDGVPHDEAIETVVGMDELSEVAVPQYDEDGDWIR